MDASSGLRVGEPSRFVLVLALLATVLLVACPRVSSATSCSQEQQTYPRDTTRAPDPIFTVNGIDGQMVWTSNALLVTTTTAQGYPGGPLVKGPLGSSASSAASWSVLTDDLKRAAGKDEKEIADSDAGVVAVHQSPVNRDVLFLQGQSRINWVSTDGGKSFTGRRSPGKDHPSLGRNEVIKFHPRQQDWLLLRTARDACDVDVEMTECVYDLMVTKDLGKSWTNITERSRGRIGGVRDFEWGAVMGSFHGRTTKDDDVFVTAYPGNPKDDGKKEEKGTGMYPGWDERLKFYFSDDLFGSAPKLEVQCGNLFEIISNRMYLAMPSTCPVDPDGNPRHGGSGSIEDRSVTMYASVDGKGFVEACLPASLEDDGYNLVSTHDDAGVFVLADHAEPGSRGPSSDSPSADAYAPAYNVSLHTLSIGNVYRRAFITDFSRVEGVPGYYLANAIDEGLSTRLFSYLKTQHSTNGGATWDLIAPPEAYRYPQACNSCPPGSSLEACALHLHGPTSWFAPEGQHPNFYSVRSAPGVVLATGNVGAHLDFRSEADCTWLSRDGGLTWSDVAPRTSVYEVSDSGGTIMLAAHRSEGPTSELQFSLDQGACFHTVKLPKAMLVENIRVGSEAVGEADTFYVYGSACSKQESADCTFEGWSMEQGILYVVRLPDLVGDDWKVCDTGSSSKSYDDFDFGGKCLLGRTLTMRRRAADGSADDFCANPPSFRQSVRGKDICQCTMDDVECEFGYERREKQCVPMPGVVAASACPRLVESGYRASDSHRRLVHSNACRNVNTVIPDTNGKGGKKGSDDTGSDASGGCHKSTSAFWKLLTFLFTTGGVAVVVGVVWSQCMAPEQQRAVLEGVQAGVEVALGASVVAVDWVRQKVRAVVGGDRSDEREYYEALSGLEDIETEVRGG